MSAETRKGLWQKLWPRLAVSPYTSEEQAGEAATWIAGRVAGLGLPQDEAEGEPLRLLQMTGLTVSAEAR